MLHPHRYKSPQPYTGGASPLRVDPPRFRGFSWQKSKNHIKTSPPIKYLTIYRSHQKVMLGKRCVTTRRITSQSPICDATNIHRRAVENVRKIDVFRAFCDATRREIIATQFAALEVNLLVGSTSIRTLNEGR